MASFWEDLKRRVRSPSTLDPGSAEGPEPLPGAAAVREVLPPDGFPLEPDAPDSGEQRLISRFLEEGLGSSPYARVLLATTAAGRDIAALGPAAAARLLGALLARTLRLEEEAEGLRARAMRRSYPEQDPRWTLVWGTRQRLAGVIEALLKRKLPLEADVVEALLAWPLEERDPWHLGWYPIPGILVAVEALAAREELPETLTRKLERLRGVLARYETARDIRKLSERTRDILGEVVEFPIDAGEVWADRALADLRALSGGERAAWSRLIAHARAATAARPSARWTKEARTLLGAAGQEAFRSRLLEWLPLVERIARREDGAPPLPSAHLIGDANGDLLRGLAWCASLEEDLELARALTSLGATAFKTVPGVGPRALKVGNAAVWALGAMPGREGVVQLSILRARVKTRSAQLAIEKALRAAAERAGISPEDLEEIAVPTHGLTELGLRQETLGERGAELRIEGPRAVVLEWIGPTGRRQAGVPAAVKRDFAEDLKELRAAQKDLLKLLPALAHRLDRLALARRTWPCETWQERYLRHPVLGVLSRRILWRFTPPDGGTGVDAITALPAGSGFTDSWGVSISIPAHAQVTPWHPIFALAEDVLAWRERLEALGLRQPFKQAHREVYLLTDAERATSTYSNRFAGHVLRQHQFHALAVARGWRCQLRLLVDAEVSPPTLELPQWGLRAELWVEGAGAEFGSDTNENGVYHRVVTDQVRFYKLDAPQRSSHAMGGGYRETRPGEPDRPLALETIPPLVFSEVMRDVDLFVGVASVGNDPTWQNGGPDGRYRDYWHEYSFGDLSQSAETRKEALARLLPRLKIAPRASLSGKFLVIRGDLRT